MKTKIRISMLSGGFEHRGYLIEPEDFQDWVDETTEADPWDYHEIWGLYGLDINGRGSLVIEQQIDNPNNEEPEFEELIEIPATNLDQLGLMTTIDTFAYDLSPRYHLSYRLVDVTRISKLELTAILTIDDGSFDLGKLKVAKSMVLDMEMIVSFIYDDKELDVEDFHSSSVGSYRFPYEATAEDIARELEHYDGYKIPLRYITPWRNHNDKDPEEETVTSNRDENCAN